MSLRICEVPIIPNLGYLVKEREKETYLTAILGLCYSQLNLIPNNTFGNTKLWVSHKHSLCSFRKDMNFAIGLLGINLVQMGIIWNVM